MRLAKQTTLVVSLTAAMTASAVLSLIVSTLVSETWLQPSWRIDDDWIWLLPPLGAGLGLALWLRYYQAAWIHVATAILTAWIGAGIVWTIQRPVPQGMQGLGAAIGRAMAIALAQMAAVTALVSLIVATFVVVALAWHERQNRA